MNHENNPTSAYVQIHLPLFPFFSNCSFKRKLCWNIILIILIGQSIYEQSQLSFPLANNSQRIKFVKFLSEDSIFFYILLTHQWVLRDSVMNKIHKLWSAIALPEIELNSRYVSRERIYFKTIFFAFISILLVSWIRLQSQLELFPPNDFISLIHFVYNFSIRSLLATLFSCLHFCLLVDLTILLTASFNYVNHLIAIEVEKGPNLVRVKKIRRLYSDIIRLTNFTAKTLDTFITIVYLYFAICLICILYQIIIHEYRFISNTLTALTFFTVPSIILLMTFRMKQVNIVSYQCLNDIYKLTLFKGIDDDIKFELIMFIHRVSRNDIGFKFFKSTLIGPNFFSTLFTLMLTIFFAGLSFIINI